MKKILCFILIAVLSLGVLTSCEQIGGVWDSVSGTVGGFIDGILGNDQPAGPNLEDAVSFLHNIYKDKNEITRADFDVVGKVIVNGVSFPVTWESDNDAVTVRPSTKTGYYTVDLPDENGTEFSYVLTATVADAEGNTATKSYTFTVPVINNSGITSTPVEGVAYKLFLLQGGENRRYYALNTTQDNKNKFINTTLDPKASADFFVEPVDGGYKVYTEVDGVKNYIYVNVEKTVDETTGTVKYSKFIGFSTENASVLSYSEKMGGTWTTVVHDLVWGIGTYGTYTTISVSEGTYFTPEKVGSSQYVMQFITADVANTYEPDKLPESPSDAKGILDQLYALADGESVAGEFKLTGVITALDNYKNPTIVVEGYENMPVYCYRLTDDRFVVGATISVTALQMKNYGGTYEFMSCTLDSITLPGQGGTDTPVDPNPETPTLGVVDPVAGTAYKFGMVQKNVGTDVYYLIGGMDGYYMATGTDANAAIDVYLEETEGGYYLYTLDAAGTKLYINMVVSGTHVNGAYEATASTVYTYNTESKTLVASVQPEGAEAPADYWFGTRNDKTYTTVGPCAVSYAGFYCQFYGEGATDGEGGEGGNTPSEPETPETVTTIPDALAAVDGTPAVIKGVVTIADAWNTQFNNMSVTIKDADGNTLYVFRLSTKVNVGDEIIVTGTVGSYNGAKQIAQGATAEIVNAHVCSEYTELTCTESSVCVVCGAVKTAAAGHTFVNGVCSVCGYVQPVGGAQTADFESFTKGDGKDNSYTSRTNNDGWTIENGRCDEQTAFGEADQIILNGKTSAVGKLTSCTLTGGIKSLSIEYGNAFSESNGVSIKINIKNAAGEVVATTDLVDTSVAQNVGEKFTWELETAITGDFVIEIINNSPTKSTSNKDRVSLWNLSWYNA